VGTKRLEAKHQTTAWFIIIMHKWFKLMSSRCQKLAFAYANQEEYENTIRFFHSFINIIRNITLSDKAWKPFQTGLLLATQTALDLQEIYLNREKFNYFMLGRLTQDALENLFSSIRRRRSVPDAREFKFALRMVCLSQFEGKIHHGNYDIADANHLIRYCDSINTLKPSAQFNDEDETVHYGLMAHFANYKLSANVKEALYSFIGALLLKVKKNFKNCHACYSSLLLKQGDHISVGHFTKLREYKEEKENLCYASQQLFNFIYECEVKFRFYEKQIVKNKINVSQLVDILTEAENIPPIPNCHGVLKNLIHIFVKSRVYFTLREQKKRIINKQDSRSVAMKAAVNNPNHNK
jgi:hypothetical protein